jgi:iron(III) transport system ATP-binding protein
MEPRLLLFDEPLSNLDAKLREQMRLEIRDLQQRLGITSVYVTHDQVEAMSISDVLVVMNGGTVEQIGSPSEVYARPANRFVADFIGKVNFVEAVFTGGAVDVAGVRWPLPDAPDVPEGSRVTLVLRPEAILMSATDGPLRGTVRRTVFLGNHAEYLVEVDGVGELVIDETDPTDRGMRAAGDTVFLSPAADALHVLPPEP